MAKKVITEGAPAYMSLYSGLMTILLAFFILLNTMQQEQQAGFKKGVGDIRNAFGSKGGFGILNYMRLVRGRSMFWRQNQEDEGSGLHGPTEDMSKGSGGSGNIDQDFDEYALDRRIRIKLRYRFEEGSAAIPRDLAEYLRGIGTTVLLFDYYVNVACVSMENDNPTRDRNLAFRRASAVMIFLYRESGLPLDRMRANGYANEEVMETSLPPLKGIERRGPQAQQETVPADEQSIYLYIYRQLSPRS